MSAKVRCGNCTTPVYSDLNDDEEYGLIMTNFIAVGGDNYKILKDNIYNVTILSKLILLNLLFVCCFFIHKSFDKIYYIIYY